MIVGSGLFGSVFAHEMKKYKQTCLVIDSRNHIGGNCYTRNENGINIQVYGPHIFHTNNKKIWDYVNQLAQFNHFTSRVKAIYKNEIFSMPINLATMNQLWGVITPEEAISKISSQIISCDNPKNLEEWALSKIGTDLYNTLIYGYTKKQWGRSPNTLPISIIKRLPIRFTYNDNYFEDIYQGIPIGGYTQIFEKLLEGIKVELQTEFTHDWQKYANKLIFTGCIDQFFNYKYGPLQYRGLKFVNENMTGDYQGVAIINYTSEDIPYTRIVEHKHFEFSKNPNTTITKEYPIQWNIGKNPYYPINDQQNNTLYGKYKEEADKLENVYFKGRLGQYKYYDMHQIIASAIEFSKLFKI